MIGQSAMYVGTGSVRLRLHDLHDCGLSYLGGSSKTPPKKMLVFPTVSLIKEGTNSWNPPRFAPSLVDLAKEAQQQEEL